MAGCSHRGDAELEVETLPQLGGEFRHLAGRGRRAGAWHPANWVSSRCRWFCVRSNSRSKAALDAGASPAGTDTGKAHSARAAMNVWVCSLFMMNLLTGSTANGHN